MKSESEVRHHQGWSKIVLPRIRQELGDLCFGEAERHIPFPIKRFYYILDIPRRAVRGAHAHRTIAQVIFPIRGALTATLSDGVQMDRVRLDRPEEGLLIGPMVWKNFQDYEDDTICLVVASDLYDEADYIRDHAEFLSLIYRRHP
jgi:hypothetical protein